MFKQGLALTYLLSPTPPETSIQRWLKEQTPLTWSIFKDSRDLVVRQRFLIEGHSHGNCCLTTLGDVIAADGRGAEVETKNPHLCVRASRARSPPKACRQIKTQNQILYQNSKLKSQKSKLEKIIINNTKIPSPPLKICFENGWKCQNPTYSSVEFWRFQIFSKQIFPRRKVL